MADNRNFQITFSINAQDQAAVVIRSIRDNLLGLSQAARQVSQDAAGLGGRIASGFQLAMTEAAKFQDVMRDIGGSLAQAGLAMAGAGAAFLGPTILAVKSAGDLEHAMNKVRAVSDATPAEFAHMTEFARKMGQDARFVGLTAKDTAQGMLELSRAGYNVSEVLATVPTVLALAASEEQNVGQVSASLVNILSAFGMSAQEASRAGNVLARTSNDSTTSMAGLSQALKFVAPVARAIGVDIEQTSAYLGVLSNNGLDASLAGTGLRRVIERLLDPTREAKAVLASLGVEVAKQADGNLDLFQTITRLRDAQMSANDAFKLFGVHGATDALILAQNADQVEKFTQRNRDAAGALDKMQTTATSGLMPALKQVAASFGALMETIGEPFLKAITKVANGLSWLLNKVTSLFEAIPALSVVFGTVGAVVGTVLAVFGSLALAAGGLLLGASALVKGWALLMRLWTEGVATTLRSTLAHREETAAIIAKTAAVKALGAAQQATSRYMGPGYYTGGRTQGGGQDTGSWVPGTGKKGGPVARPSQQPRADGFGGAFGAVALAGAGLGLNQMTSDLDGFEGALTNTANTSAQLALNIGLLGPILGTVVTGFTSWVQVLPKLGQAWEFLKGDIANLLPNWLKNLGKALAATPSPAYNTEDLVKSYQARILVAQSQGEKLSEIQRRLRKEIDEGVKAGTIDGKTRQGIEDALTEAINREAEALNRRNKALEEMGKGLGEGTGGLFAEYTDAKMVEKASKDMEQSISRFYKHQAALDDNAIALQKANINRYVQSKQQAEAQITALEQWAANQRITKAEAEYSQQMARLEGEKARKIAISPKDAGLIEKETAEQVIKVQEAFTKAYEGELSKRIQALEKHTEQVKQLEDELFKVQQTNTEGLEKFRQGSLSEGQKLEASVNALQAKYAQAVALMPTMPERAKALFLEAQSLANGLAQNIKSLEENLKGVRDSFQQSYLSLAKLGKSPQTAFQLDMSQVHKALSDAQAALSTGEYADAQKKAEAARQKIDSLISQAGELYGPSGADAILGPLLAKAQAIAETAGQGQLDQAKDVQRQAEDTFTNAGKNIETIISRQIETLKQQMTVEQQLVEALRALAAQLGAKTGTIPQGLSGATGAEIPSLMSGLPPAAVGAGLPPSVPSLSSGLGSLFGASWEGLGADKAGSFERAADTLANIMDRIAGNVSGTVNYVSESMQRQRTGREGESEPADMLQLRAQNEETFGMTVQEFITGVREYVKQANKPVEVKVTINESGQASAMVWT